MSEKSNDEQAIRAYLLGQLPEAEEDAIDNRLLVDDGYFEHMEMIEDELIGDYASGSLSSSDRAAFDARFLIVPERRWQVEIALAMHRYTRDHPIALPAPPDATVTKSAEPAVTPRYRQTVDIDQGEGERRSRNGLDLSPRDWGGFSFAWTPYLRIGASLLLLVAIGAAGYRLFFYKSDLDKDLEIVQELHRNERPFEARLSSFEYAPHIETRGANDTPTLDDLQPKRDYVKNDLAEMLRQHPDANVNHAIGAFYLADRQIDKAIPFLVRAIESAPTNGAFHNDLGVALLEKGSVEGQSAVGTLSGGSNTSPSEALSKSLAEFNRALELDPISLAPLFNRALCWQRIGDNAKAKADWRAYLEKDSKSEWAAEARSNLAKLR